MSVLSQLFVASAVSLLFFSLPLFDALNGKFDRFQNESDTKSGWAPVTGAIAILLATLIIPTIGRRITFLITACSFVFGWILITYTKSCEVVDYFQVIVAGHAIVAFSRGLTYPISSVYLAEIIQPALYGMFSVLPSISFNLGTLVYNTFHDHFTYTHIAFFAAALHVIFLLLSFFFNESPLWLAAKELKKEQREENKRKLKEVNESSEKSTKLNGVLLEMGDTPTTVVEWATYNDDVFEPESKQIIVDDVAAIPKVPETGEIADGSEFHIEELNLVEKVDETSLLDLLKIPKFSFTSNFSSLTVALQLIFLSNYCGMSSIQLHMVKFYEAIDATKDEDYVLLLIDKIKLGGSLASLVIIVLVTRKKILYFSFSTMALSLMAIGSYFFIKTDNTAENIVAGYEWIPFALSVIFIIGYSAGIGTIVWLVMAEVLPDAYRDILATIATAFHWICIYGIFILFKNNRGKSLLYTDVLFWMHGFICIYGIIFVKSCIPDGKGCSLEDLIGILTTES